MTTVASKLPGLREQTARFDVERLRRDFPILAQPIHGHKLVYLDNAATSQKPRAVIEAIAQYYEHGNANIHRAVHFLSEHATEEYERARLTAQRFINAASVHEVIFVRGTTEAINLVAQTHGRAEVGAGDETSDLFGTVGATSYDLSVSGPNAFLRTFAGGLAPGSANLTVQAIYDKDAEGVIDAMKGRIDRWFVATPPSERAKPAAEVATLLAGRGLGRDEHRSTRARSVTLVQTSHSLISPSTGARPYRRRLLF